MLEIKPKRLIDRDRDRAWEYDVFFTPEQGGLHTSVIRLNLEYAGEAVHLHLRSYGSVRDNATSSPCASSRVGTCAPSSSPRAGDTDATASGGAIGLLPLGTAGGLHSHRRVVGGCPGVLADPYATFRLPLQRPQ